MAANGRDFLNDRLIQFIREQQLFFVATAAPDGRVNLSPKGMDTLRVMSEPRIVWLNLSGSGNETAAHLRESDRMTLMFCAFEGRPLILRTYGHARAYHPRDPGWDRLAPLFPELPGARQIIDLDIDLVLTSCGTGVPEYQFVRGRGETDLLPFYDKMGQDGVEQYWHRKNRTSIDGKATGTV